MNRLRLLIVWTATALVLFFLLHPRFSAQFRAGSAWEEMPALDESRWLWNPPDPSPQFRFRPDFARLAIYLVSTFSLAAAALASLRPSRPSRPAAVPQPDPKLAQTEIFSQPPVESSLAHHAKVLAEIDAQEKAKQPRPPVFGWN